MVIADSDIKCNGSGNIMNGSRLGETKHHLYSNFNINLKASSQSTKSLFSRRLVEREIKEKQTELQRKEDDIKKNSRFSMNVKNKYLQVINSIETHKIKVLLAKYKQHDNNIKKHRIQFGHKNMIKASNINFNTLEDVLSFKNELIKTRNVLNETSSWQTESNKALLLQKANKNYI